MTHLVFAPDLLLYSLRIFILFVVILAVYNAVEAIYMHLGTANIFYTLLIGIITSLFFIDISVLVESKAFDNRVTISARILGNIPYFIVILFAFALTLGNFLMLYKLIHHKQNTLSADTVKYTMDGMNDGICFFYENGETILVNIQMNKISSELFGTEIMNGQLFKKSILSGNYNSGTLLKTTPAIFIETSDKKVWNIQFNKHSVKNIPIYSVTAYDVTEQIRLYREIKKNNAILSNMNKRLKDYNKAIKQVVADNETLAVKVRVHDNLGRVLLAARNVLLNHGNEEEKTELLNLWDEAVLVMKNESKTAVHKDTLALLMQAAKSVHAKIEIDGDLPNNRKTRDLIITAAHECLTNTVKHAKGDLLNIKIKNFEYYTEAIYTNNGDLPSAPIKESGGLANLRKIVEKSGGTMKTEINPQFMLILNLPEGEDFIWKK